MFTNGRFFLVLGIIFLLIGFFTNTTVSSSFGEVHNLGLMNEKQNYIILGGFLLLAGVILQSKSSRKSDVEDDVNKDSTHEPKKITGVVHEKKTLKESISGLSRDKKLGLQASLFFSSFVSIFILIIIRFIQLDLAYYLLMLIPLFISLSYALNSSDESRSSWNLINYTKKIAYVFTAICFLWLLAMIGIFLFGSFGDEKGIFLDPSRFNSIDLIKMYFYVLAPNLFSLVFGLLTIFISKKWIKTIE